MKFTLTRRGEFTIASSQTTKTQCTALGHRDFKYSVTCTMKNPRLDENGFLIDHHRIDEFIMDYFMSHPMLSCEQMLLDVSKYAIKRLTVIFNMVEFSITMSPKLEHDWLEPEAVPVLTLNKSEIKSIQKSSKKKNIPEMSKLWSELRSATNIAEYLLNLKTKELRDLRNYLSNSYKDFSYIVSGLTVGRWSTIIYEVFLEVSEPRWRDSTGAKWKVSEMETSHLNNAIVWMTQNTNDLNKYQGITFGEWRLKMMDEIVKRGGV